jgi:tetratricopeptide (TPR) repeat protein
MSYYQFVAQETEFWEQINHLLATDRRDPVILSRLKNQAHDIFNLDAYEGHIALGVIASLEGNVEAIHAHYQQAIEDFSRKPELVASYAESLARVGHFSPAAELMLEAYYLSPSTLNYLDKAIQLCGIVGRFQFISELLRIRGKINLWQTPPFATNIEQILQWMKQNQVTDDQLEKQINLALSLLQQYHILITPRHVEIALDEDQRKLYYKIHLAESTETITKIITQLNQPTIATNLSAIIDWKIVSIL